MTTLSTTPLTRVRPWLWRVGLWSMLLAAGTATAQNLRPESTFFIKPRLGISNYLGDNEKSPTNFNGDVFQIDGKLPYGLLGEVGYQVSVPFSISLAYQVGNYPIITQFGDEEGHDRDIDEDPTIRHTAQFFGRYTHANTRTRVAPFVDFGAAYSFGNVAQPDRETKKQARVFGLLVGVGLDLALNDRTSFFIESVTSIAFNDTALDANNGNGFGSTDLLTGLGLGLKINFKRAFTPLKVSSVDCPNQLNVGEQGSFAASTNEEALSQPVEHRWSFGDGTTTTGLDASHSYARAGIYTATFTAAGPGGKGTDTGQCSVRAIASPEIVDLTADRKRVDTCEQAPPVHFSANVQGDTPLTYTWDFGDGATGTGDNPSYRYTTEGAYTVRLTLSNPAGSDTSALTITARPCTPLDPEKPEESCEQMALRLVFFERNMSTFSAQGLQAMEKNVTILQQCPILTVRVEGFASESESNPQQLIEDRARAITCFYVMNDIEESRIVTTSPLQSCDLDR